MLNQNLTVPIMAQHYGETSTSEKKVEDDNNKEEVQKVRNENYIEVHQNKQQTSTQTTTGNTRKERSRRQPKVRPQKQETRE
jgi:hypothetical protein